NDNGVVDNCSITYVTKLHVAKTDLTTAGRTITVNIALTNNIDTTITKPTPPAIQTTITKRTSTTSSTTWTSTTTTTTIRDWDNVLGSLICIT
ncbi:unnamed protein product, partial [Rotaria socialis]